MIGYDDGVIMIDQDDENFFAEKHRPENPGVPRAITAALTSKKIGKCDQNVIKM